ncbi:hypothetical protein FO059_18035 (plasmid) [Tomitella fengzijianii]|uniref:Uncharacterized protein n=1 Tax=Tomitella fengzijianii TaxID=2597660 RepID=A0A516X8U9_9ACTN|nr:hypothetical protein [Tomitella fengzijianii]QDQ99500.1 hypothetical protein FO059_18035 [Tomitella fengzijianii]
MSIVSAAIAWTQNRKASSAAADAAAVQQRAAEAAAQSAVPAAQSAEAHTALAQHADVAAQRPLWELRHAAGDKHELVNDGPTDRFAVRVDGESIALVSGQNPISKDRLTAGSSLPFMAASTTETNSAISVSWHDAPGLRPGTVRSDDYATGSPVGTPSSGYAWMQP